MLHQTDKEMYWQTVGRALDALIGAPAIDAARGLRTALEALPPEAQEIFYHSEPLEVAKDLAGLRACTPDQTRDYLDKVQRVSRFPSDAAPRPHPR